MPSDTEARKEAPPDRADARRGRLRELARPAARLAALAVKAFRGWSARSAAFLDYLAEDAERRQRAAILLAIAFNTVLFTALAIFGRFQIWIPSAPGDYISVVMTELPTESVLPELTEPEVVPEPQPEPEPEPEIIEELELEPEPVPEPEPEPPAPEPQPEPEPEPVLDLTPAPLFAPPAEPEEEAFIPAPEEEASPAEEGLGVVAPEPAPEAAAEREQSPAEEEERPLTEAEPQPEPAPGVEAAPGAGEEADAAAGEEEAAPEPERPAGDDLFDQEPILGGSRLTLPAVDLPEGEAALSPGASGVVAIFCPDAFADEDKAAECAGRTEIRSGWRPGASGEDWSKARALFNEQRAQGIAGPDLDKVVGPAESRRIMDAKRARDLVDFRRGGVDAGVDPTSAGSGAQEFGRPAIGPSAIEPSWTLREDPEVTQKDLRELDKVLKDAEDAKTPSKDDDKE